MVTVSEVIALVLLILTPSSLKNALLELMTGVSVTPPFPLPVGFTVREITVVCVSVPLNPVMVTAAGPVTAPVEAVKVTVLVDFAVVGLKLAVTPEGSPLALRETLPLKPPLTEIPITLEALAPCVSDKLAGLADNPKSGDPPCPFKVLRPL